MLESYLVTYAITPMYVLATGPWRGLEQSTNSIMHTFWLLAKNKNGLKIPAARGMPRSSFHAGAAITQTFQAGFLPEFPGACECEFESTIMNNLWSWKFGTS